MKKIILTTALFAVSFLGFAQIPAYYNDNDIDISLSGQNLLDELASKITDTHTTFLSYTPGVWTALQAADIDPNDNSEVILVYGYNDSDSDLTNDRTRGINNNGGDSDDWNREHVFPRSLGNPNLGSTGPGSDAHHIRPADVSRNSARANRIFADGSGNSGTTADGYWYPGDEWKGDVARMIMYMYARYNDRCLPTAVGDGSSLATDSNMIDLFLEWNVEDPVSEFELQRNEVIATIQGNRNPFIDNPAFATTIWGGDQAEDLFGINTSPEVAPVEESTASVIISEYVEGSSNNKAIEITNLSESSINLSDYSLKRDTNGSGVWSSSFNLSGTLSSGNTYVIANSSASSTLLDLANTTSNSTVMTFNGNDPIGLFFNDTLIDIVGTFGGGSSNFAINQTLVRNSNINSATTIYISSQWESFSVNTYTNLGSFNGNVNTSTSIQTTLSIIFDNFSSETSWDIVNSSNTIVSSGGDYNQANGTSISESISLPAADCYTLNFYDSFGDGICCTQGNGSFLFTNNTTGNTITSGGSFSTIDSNNFCLSSTASKDATNLIPEVSENIFELVIYPNPTADTIYFTTENQLTNTNYRIFNETGAEVKSGISNDNNILVEELATGLYFIEINGLPATPFIKN